ncbi:hypothetical protein BC829DRAFT_447405 [Chytridium lagenaria]|nr:hypothetical protein BC829DRAFT_447405 [Chytridium lagenaria]
MVSLSQAFFALLDRDLGIKPSASCPQPPPLPLKQTIPTKPTRERKKEEVGKKRTDSAFGTVGLRRRRAPLTLKDLGDEDVEEVFEDCVLEERMQALDWSDEALPLARLSQKLHRTSHLLASRRLADLNKSMHEAHLRGQETQATPSVDVEATGFSAEFLYEYFRTLRLVDLGIAWVDEEAKRFRVREMSLTGNRLKDVGELWEGVEVLHKRELTVSFGSLSECPNLTHLKRLVHIGCGYNSISSLRCSDPLLTDPFTWFPETLVSLDLSGNNLIDLDETVATLENARNLKILSLMKNPIALLKVYRTVVVSRLWKLVSLDEVGVTNFERGSLARKKFNEDDKTCIKLLLHLQEMTALKQPDVEATEDRPLDEVKYFVRAGFGEGAFGVSSCALGWLEEVLDFKDETVIEAGVTKEFRDALNGGFTLCLFEQRFTYVAKETQEAEPNSIYPINSTLHVQVLAYEREVGRTCVGLEEVFAPAGSAEVLVAIIRLTVALNPTIEERGPEETPVRVVKYP